ncbi:MAG TPA: hypothetical protein VMX38_21280 [Verrucomicrobiae bacterium]|nr:hypothetical protein [Verrucomicrobiae bacterium]
MTARRVVHPRPGTASVLILAFACLLPACANQPAQRASAPLVVNQDSQVVVMEYENWFGPKARNFQTTPAMPMLQSPDMQVVGGGYDSADPAVWGNDLSIVQQQVASYRQQTRMQRQK